jgi:hypothetical protein
MHRFWTRYIKPIVETVSPERILEVGAEFGWNTRKLLEYCRENGVHLDVVDPVPHEALLDAFVGHNYEFTYHPLKSLEAIPNLPPAELVLLDGDHNWFTVYNELQLLYLHAEKAGKLPPLVLFHDIAWPYARRDMYYNPEGLNVADRQPYAYRGILPEQSELTEAGLNGRFANALHEGGPRNGVLTGVEDFQASVGVATTLYLLPFFNGLGILVPQVRMTSTLQTLIDGFYSSESLLETCKSLEKDGMFVRAELAALKATLSNVTMPSADVRNEVSPPQDQGCMLRRKMGNLRHLTRRLKIRFAGSHSGV